MSKKEIFLISIISLLVIGGPIYVLFLRDKPDKPAPQNTTQSQPQKQTPDTPPQVVFDKSQYSLSDAASIWVVANKQRPLDPKTYAPSDLVSVGGGQQMRSEPAKHLAELIAAAKAEGLGILPMSGYRSYATQVSVYNNEVKTYGQAAADTESARPGTSEHQTGLAIDVGGGGCGIEDCFGATKAGQWLAANAHRFGFIIRYPEGKQSITGYRYEPWHIRYVGTDLASEMQKQGVKTLEEFFALPAAPTY